MIVALQGKKAFWIAQSIGWAVFALSNVTIQALVGFPAQLIVLNTGTTLVSGVLVTTVYWLVIRRIAWGKVKLWQLWGVILLSTVLLSIGWLLLTGLAFGFLTDDYGISFNDVLGNLVNGCLLFFIWNLIYFFFKYFVRYQTAETERWKLDAKSKEAQLGVLKAQINPHFIFNTLNNIRSLILENPRRSREMLSNFSDLFRYALQYSQRSLVLVEDEVAMLRQYLELMDMQYEDRLNYQIEVEEACRQEQMPPMILQLLVENAIKHGIDRAIQGGDIFIHIKKEAGRCVICVENTGHLQTSATATGLGEGLANIRKRLALLYGEAGQMHLSEQDGRVITTLSLPLKKTLVSEV